MFVSVHTIKGAEPLTSVADIKTGAPHFQIPKMGYQPALDGLRSIAIGLVLLQHTGLWIFEGGRNGVIVFFVLSGFLITKLLIEEWGRTSRISIRSFYVRRTIRIMPAPFLMILIMFLLRDQFTPDPQQQEYFVKELLFAGLYITNLRPLWGGVPDFVERTYMAHTWSLAVEEHFYLVWPVGFRLIRLPKKSPMNAIWGLLTFALVITVVRQILVAVAPDVVAFSLFSFDGFAIGAALAFAMHFGVAQSVLRFLSHSWIFWVGLGILVADMMLGEWLHKLDYYYFTYTGLAAAIMIGSLMLNQRSWGHSLMALPLVVYIGKLSYSLYLWHVPVQAYFSTSRFPDMSIIELAVIEWPLTFIVAMASYHLVELPLVGLRRRFSK